MDCTKFLAEGIQERNKGNFQKAIDLFEHCKSIDINDSRIYENTYKVEFFRKNFELAFRNLMVITHSEIIADSVRNHPIGQAVYIQDDNL